MTTTTQPTWIDLKHEHRDAYRALAALTRAGHLDTRTLELVKVRASMLNGCDHCTHGHTELALAAGEDAGRIEALAAWEASDAFTDRERAALALTDALTLLPSQGVPPVEVVGDAAARFSGEELARLIVAITAINAWNRIALTTTLGRTDG
jgi:AhpD family alkylhydroperoxidase